MQEELAPRVESIIDMKLKAFLKECFNHFEHRWSHFRDSKILSEPRHFDFLRSELPSIRHSSQVSLIYRSSRDGWRTVDFHHFCDNVGPTVLLLKTSKGKVCGGYTFVSWTSSGTFASDERAFLFSVSNEQRYVCRDMNRAVFHSEAGPSFGGCSLDID